MPKSSKKKKEKRKDFARTKLKVGAKKQPSNATDTSYKTRSIVLPQQGIDKVTVQQSSRASETTLDDILSKCHHHNRNIRIDALERMQEFLRKYSDASQRFAGKIINSLVRLIIDEDVQVRKNLRNLIQNHLIPNTDLQPFAGLLLTYTLSAMTHIYEDVRMDTLKILDLWLDILSPQTIELFWDRLFANYMSLISPNVHQSTSGSLVGSNSSTPNHPQKKQVAQKQREVALKSLVRFVSAGLKGEKQSALTKSQHDSLTWDTTTFISHVNIVMNIKSSIGNVDAITAEDLATLFEVDGSSATNVDRAVRVLTELGPHLLHTWIETSPALLEIQSGRRISPENMNTLESILEILHVLWKSGGTLSLAQLQQSQWVEAAVNLGNIAKHIAPYFPLVNSGASAQSVDLGYLNAIMCELMTLSSCLNVALGHKSKRKNVHHLAAFIKDSFGIRAESFRHQLHGARLDTVESLLSSAWLLLHFEEESEAMETLSAILEYVQHGTLDANTAQCIEFLSVMQDHISQVNPSLHNQQFQQKLQQWIESSPPAGTPRKVIEAKEAFVNNANKRRPL